MLAPLRYVLLAVSLAALMYGDDITIPMDGGGNIQIRNPQFIRVDQFNIFNPELTFTLIDNSLIEWTTVKLEFGIAYFCKDELRQLSAPVDVFRSTKDYKIRIESLTNELQFCKTEMIKATIAGMGIDGLKFNPEELKELKERKAKRDEQERRIAEEKQIEKRIAAEERAKKEAAEAKARKAAAAAAFNRRAEAEGKVIEACAVIYKRTINRRVADLTVKEERQVRACQVLGLYPPD